MIAELYGMPMIDHEENMSMEGADAAYGQIVRLLGISDSDYDDLSKTLSSIIKQCFIRAAFLFVSEENLEELKAKYHSFLEDKAYIEEHNPKNHRQI